MKPCATWCWRERRRAGYCLRHASICKASCCATTRFIAGSGLDTGLSALADHGTVCPSVPADRAVGLHSRRPRRRSSGRPADAANRGAAACLRRVTHWNGWRRSTSNCFGAMGRQRLSRSEPVGSGCDAARNPVGPHTRLLVTPPQQREGNRFGSTDLRLADWQAVWTRDYLMQPKPGCTATCQRGNDIRFDNVYNLIHIFLY